MTLKSSLLTVLMVIALVFFIELGYGYLYILGVLIFGCFMHRKWIKDYCKQWWFMAKFFC